MDSLIFYYQNKGVKKMEQVKKIEVSLLSEFKNHPFQVNKDVEFYELERSIENDGILVPLLARPNPHGEGYELISGHRRKAACEELGIKEVPVIIREMSDDQAIIAMVDSNLQREHIKPSEKAYAYKMKLEAMKRQGARTDLTFSQVEKKLEESNPTLQLSEVTCGIGEDGIWQISNTGNKKARYANEVLAKQVGESRAQISRYIRLTYLIPQILRMVDDGRITFTVAVELSYLKEDEQYELYAVMDLEQCTPSLPQANRIKRMSQSGLLDMDMMYTILEEEKPNQKEKISIRADVLEPYFPKGFSPKQKIELIETLVKEWHEQQTLDVKNFDDDIYGRGSR